MIRSASCRVISGFLAKSGQRWPLLLLGNKRLSLVTTLGTAKPPVYDMKKIGLENFEYTRVLALNSIKDTKKYGTQASLVRLGFSVLFVDFEFFLDDIKASLSKLVNNESEVFNLATFGDDLDFFMLVSNSDEDIELVTKALKL